MTAAVLETAPFAFPAQAAGRTAAALRSLMQIWEQETVSEDEESDSELMVMLSGMVGPQATALDGE
jgi:hypothetical protein